MIIKRRNKTLIKGDYGTILTEACTLMIDIRRALSKALPDEAVEKAMQYIVLAAQSKGEEEHLKKVRDFEKIKGGENNGDRD